MKVYEGNRIETRQHQCIHSAWWSQASENEKQKGDKGLGNLNFWKSEFWFCDLEYWTEEVCSNLLPPWNSSNKKLSIICLVTIQHMLKFEFQWYYFLLLLQHTEYIRLDYNSLSNPALFCQYTILPNITQNINIIGL